MNKPRKRRPIDNWDGTTAPPGESTNVELTVGESYTGMPIKIPIRVCRAIEEGPVVFVTAALHGDEINGTGAVRRLIQDPDLHLLRGSVVFVPVLNLLAFERHSRYLPDRRDLNRSFPGSSRGSLAGRLAYTITHAIVSRCDYGIDLHSAAVRRSNYPNIRADLSNPEVRRFAEAFGSEILVNSKGPANSFRREATARGCPTIIMEGGEVWKVEPGIVAAATHGVKNVLRHLEMLAGEPERPRHQIIVKESKWIRAEHGGFLQFHVNLGDVVDKGQPLATNTSLLGAALNTLYAPFAAVVIGISTLPAISPGEPIFNLGRLPPDVRPEELRRLRAQEHGLDEQVLDTLSSSVLVVDCPSSEPEAVAPGVGMTPPRGGSTSPR